MDDAEISRRVLSIYERCTWLGLRGLARAFDVPLYRIQDITRGHPRDKSPLPHSLGQRVCQLRDAGLGRIPISRALGISLDAVDRNLAPFRCPGCGAMIVTFHCRTCHGAMPAPFPGKHS